MPAAPGLVPVWIVIPVNCIEGWFESVANRMRKVVQDGKVKVPPDQLIKPAQCTVTPFAPGATRQFSNGYRAKT